MPSLYDNHRDFIRLKTVQGTQDLAQRLFKLKELVQS